MYMMLMYMMLIYMMFIYSLHTNKVPRDTEDVYVAVAVSAQVCKRD